MNNISKLLLLLTFITGFYNTVISQNIIENYEPKRNDSIRVGIGEKDFMPLIQKGYTLMLPESKAVEGVLIFLEDSGYDDKNKNAKQLYNLASTNNFAVLSVSSEIPFDFYFSEDSMLSTHNSIRNVFSKYDLPNDNIFFLGTSLVGHRALKYIEYMKRSKFEFQLHIKGLILCNLTLDWTRKWYQHQRDIRINQIDLWEPKFMNYMLETHLNGTPKTVPENYHNFSSYSYFDKSNRNIVYYKDYAVRAYIQPDITYRLKKYLRTLYENNATDIVGFLAELKIIGNKTSELIILPTPDETDQNRNSQAVWDKVDKNEMMEWIKMNINE